jgi:hypothetical protein
MYWRHGVAGGFGRRDFTPGHAHNQRMSDTRYYSEQAERFMRMAALASSEDERDECSRIAAGFVTLATMGVASVPAPDTFLAEQA